MKQYAKIAHLSTEDKLDIVFDVIGSGVKFAKEISANILKCADKIEFWEKNYYSVAETYLTIWFFDTSLSIKDKAYIGYHSARLLQEMGYKVYLQCNPNTHLPINGIIRRKARKTTPRIIKLYNFSQEYNMCGKALV